MRPPQIEAIATASDLPARLATALRDAQITGPPWSGMSIGHLSRSAWHMSPELSYGRHKGPPPETAQSAAVLLLLFRRHGRWHVPLTERPAALARHGGQISLPGGRIEPGETAEQAARRELVEELGVDTEVELLGRLPNCYVYASDYAVAPLVAATMDEPQWRPDGNEVERVVELPITVLLDTNSVGQVTIHRGPLSFRAPCFVFGNDRVWGATSVILGELADVLRGVG